MPILVLQRGHVPRKSGATGTAGEQAMAIAVGDAVARTARKGWTVRLINADEPSSRYRGDAFVAVHGDGSPSASVSGASVGYQSSQGAALAAAWKAAYAKVFPGSFRADNYTANLATYYGVRNAIAQGNSRAIIIEVGFMTNRTDRAWIDANHAAIAASIWTAVAGKESRSTMKYSLYLVEGLATPLAIDTYMKAMRAADLATVSRGSTYMTFAQTSADIDTIRKAARAAGAKAVSSKPWAYIPTRQDQMVPLIRKAVEGGGLSAL